MGMFENQVFTQKWKFFKDLKLFSLFIQNNPFWQIKSCIDVFIWDKEPNDNVRKKVTLWKVKFDMKSSTDSDETNVNISRKTVCAFVKNHAFPINFHQHRVKTSTNMSRGWFLNFGLKNTIFTMKNVKANLFHGKNSFWFHFTKLLKLFWWV